MPYAYNSLLQVQAQLAQRLDDPTNTFWLQSELTAHINEALRVWGALTGYWRGRMTFAFATSPFVDLTTQTGTLIPFTVTDTQLVNQMAYHLIEPSYSGGSWAGTDQFGIVAITQALQYRRNQFLAETGIVTTHSQPFAGMPPTTGRIALPDVTIEVRHAAWQDNASKLWGVLWRSDEWAAQSMSPLWSVSPQSGPTGYSVGAPPPLTLQLIPPASAPGTLDILVVRTGPNLDPSTGVLMSVPDNLAHYVKWGALADLLASEGAERDATRIQYCEQRYQEGVAAARLMPSVATAFLNGVQLFPSTLEGLDSMYPSWMNNAAGTPTIAALASWNTLVVTPLPTPPTPAAFMCDIVQNAPILVLPGDFIQVGREELDAITGYAQHIASFKQGGDEFAATIPLYDAFVRLAQTKNERLRAGVPFYKPMADESTNESRETVYRSQETGVAA